MTTDRYAQRAVALLAAALFATRDARFPDNADDVVDNATKFYEFIRGKL